MEWPNWLYGNFGFANLAMQGGPRPYRYKWGYFTPKEVELWYLGNRLYIMTITPI